MNKNFLLGIPALLPDWKKLFSKQYFAADLTAGITVALVAIPLSLAIALASGVSPGVGLITAIVAGIVCAFFGGAPLTVSGPAAAMSVLLADTVQNFGIEALVFVCLIAGVMQLVSGMIGLGRFARYIPLPVISGFTAGIGVIILIGQLPRAFGLAPPTESHVIDVFYHIKEYFNEINGTCLLLVVITLVVIRGLPKLLPKVQPILPAVAITTLLVYFFHLDVALIGNIPDSLPSPHLPNMPNISLSELFLSAFTIFILASLETLLSSTAIDKLSGNKKHDSNQELIGQGLGNIAVSMFGGIPVTGVIARSATNWRSGAKTRRASIIHALIILAAVYFIAPVIGLIPIAALAGVLFSIALSMINYREFYDLWVTARIEALTYIVTFFTIISVDLIAGVQAGIIVAAMIVLFKATRPKLHISATSQDDIIRLSLTGALTFLSIGKISNLEKQSENAHVGQTVLVDLSSIIDLDTSGAAAIVDLYKQCRNKGVNFYIKGLPRRFESLFRMTGDDSFLDECYLVSEQQLRKHDKYKGASSSRSQLIHGVQRFHAEQKYNDKRLFEHFAERQDPHTLFITCSDSRIIPSVITSSDPGELFIVRNVGNCIPPYQPNSQYSERAALEFSLNNLDITDIVICGHANCAAIKSCEDSIYQSLPDGLKSWIGIIKSQLDQSANYTELNQAIRQNVLNQITNLKNYPDVQKKLAMGTLNIHGWFFNFNQSMVYEWDANKQSFDSLVNQEQLLLPA